MLSIDVEVYLDNSKFCNLNARVTLNDHSPRTLSAAWRLCMQSSDAWRCAKLPVVFLREIQCACASEKTTSWHGVQELLGPHGR